MYTNKILPPIYTPINNKTLLRYRIIKNFPEQYKHMIYYEPFLGGGSILFNKDPSIIEFANDINEQIIDILAAIKYDGNALFKQLKKIKYSKETFIKFKNYEPNNLLERAIKNIVLNKMSFDGKCKSYLHITNNIRKNVPKQVHAFNNMIIQIPYIYQRIKHVNITCMNAIDILNNIIASQVDNRNTLIYIDPPSLYDKEGKNIFNISDHELLGEILNELKCNIIISNHHSKLYSTIYENWNMQCISSASAKRATYIWTNY